MNKNYLSILLAVCILFPIIKAEAHPGRTDANGGHTCRTNCEKWGLEYGEYHYHNGGSSDATTPNSNSGSPPTPSYTQADVEEGKAAGKEQGYEDGYNRKEKASESNSGNEGYEQGFTTGYDAGYLDGLKAIQEKDKKEGAKQGKKDGQSDYRENGEQAVREDSAKSQEWNSSYQEAYIKAFTREQSIHQSEEKGYDLGYSLEKLVIPKNYLDDETLMTSFKTHYEKGYETRSNEEKAKQLEQGKKNGYELAKPDTTSINKKFISSYEQGYEEGKLSRKKEVLKEGYQDAYLLMNYEVPESYNQKDLLAWHKEGYDSNNTAVNIKETAFENGHTNADYFIPEEYKENKESVALYNTLFEDGQALRKQEQRKKAVTTIGIGLPLGGITLGGTYLLVRRQSRRKID
ncbi:hypothetical protein J14TS2_00340 [Bacillus sp. J14TS2]|nr:YHYH domain-containing protein [Bacillus sp. J14TS2]GIN69559.1 hypothetical protein J14TS2_00340 [Bacillus sp. J14TS2]